MTDADYPSKVLQRALSTADYLASRNLDGLAALKRHCAQTSGKEGDHPDLPVAPLPDGWPRAIPLKGACMTGSMATLAYLFERGADPDLVDVVSGDTACHVAVAWGRVDAVAYLLARGARHDISDGDGLTLAGAARRRQKLLERGDAAFAERLRSRGMDIDALRDEGRGLVKLLDAVEARGSWRAFAVGATHRPRVARAAPWLKAAADRSSLAIARALASRRGTPVAVVQETKKTPSKAAAKKRLAAAEDRATRDAMTKVAASDPPLEKALFEAGLVSPAPGEHHLVNPVFPRALRWLDCATLEDVRALERNDVSRVEGPSSSERRELWLFCCAARKRRDDAVAEARAAAAADVERDEARRREASRSVDPRAAVAFRVPLACFARVAGFLFHAPPPPPKPERAPAHVLALLEGVVRAPPGPGK